MKGIGPQGLGRSGNNGYSIGSPDSAAKIAPLVAMAGKALMGAMASKVADKVVSPGKFKNHKMYGKNGEVENVKSKAKHDKLDAKGYGHSVKTPAKLKDACYKKVKAKYDVFPSAYASGAIAKCRKNS